MTLWHSENGFLSDGNCESLLSLCAEFQMLLSFALSLESLPIYIYFCTLYYFFPIETRYSLSVAQFAVIIPADTQL